jgi:hypothetical protein
MTLLHEACLHQRCNVAEFLLSFEPNINLQNNVRRPTAPNEPCLLFYFDLSPLTLPSPV